MILALHEHFWQLHSDFSNKPCLSLHTNSNSASMTHLPCEPKICFEVCFLCRCWVCYRVRSTLPTLETLCESRFPQTTTGFRARLQRATCYFSIYYRSASNLLKEFTPEEMNSSHGNQDQNACAIKLLQLDFQMSFQWQQHRLLCFKKHFITNFCCRPTIWMTHMPIQSQAFCFSEVQALSQYHLLGSTRNSLRH